LLAPLTKTLTNALLAALEQALSDAPDREPELIDRRAQTATIRARLADQVSTERLVAASQSGLARKSSDSADHLALERRIDPGLKLATMGYDLGLFEAQADHSDHAIMRMLGDRPLVLLVHTAGMAPEQRSEVAQGLDAIIDDVVAAAPDSAGDLFMRFHRHLRKVQMPGLGAVAVLVDHDGERVCVSCCGTPPPCLFQDRADGLRLQQVGYRDPELGGSEMTCRETWVDLEPGAGLAVISPGSLRATDGEGTAFDMPHVAASIILNADLSAQELAEAVGEDIDHHAEGQLRNDATVLILKRK
jgi:hypothetical protein